MALADPKRHGLKNTTTILQRRRCARRGRNLNPAAFREEVHMESREVLVGAPAAAAVVASAQTQKFSLFALTMMVVGSMVGAGIWSLPRTFGTATGVFGALIAWLIAAGGMYTLARVLQRSRSVSLTSTPASMPMLRPGLATISGFFPPSAIFSALVSAIRSTGC